MAVIYINGNIITMDDDVLFAQAIRIDGKYIDEVGSNEEILSHRQSGDQIIDLQGKTMMPSFIDPHSHFTGLANSLSQCDLHEARSFAEIIARMKEFIEKNQVREGEWVFGSGYDHNLLEEKRHPDKFVLDQISSTHPIVLVHASSHMGAVNSLALKKQGIDEKSVDPEGGKFYRVTDSDEPNGFMEENAFIAFQNSCPMIKPETLFKLMEKAQKIYASYGITTIQEGMVSAALFSLLDEASKRDVLYLDLIGYIDLKQDRRVLLEHRKRTMAYQNHFKIGGYKIFLDGSPQGRTAWMSTPYANEESYCGYPAMSDEQLHELIRTALDDDQQLLAHCNGDAAAEQYITQFEKAVEEIPSRKPKRPVMIHAQLVRKDQLKRMKPLNMMPSFFIAHIYHWGEIHIQNFGKKRADLISPAKDALDIGIPFTFHQDSPVIQPDMMETVWCAVNRLTEKGTVLGVQEKIEVMEALRAVTIHAAYQYFEEDIKGSIKKGKQADLVILDADPLTIQRERLKDIRVLETIKEGRTIFQR